MPTSEILKVVFGVLTTYERNGWVHPTILQFFADLPFSTGHGYRLVPVHNFHPAASGRNVLCKHLKDCDADWVCMIDNDMEIPANLLDTVKDAPADADIIVPSFYCWDQGSLKLTLCWGMDNEPQKDGVGCFQPGFYELSKAGTGVIFIRPSVFNKISYPYFSYLYNEDQGMQGTEDIQFCLKARKAGLKIYGNAGITIGHYHNVELSSLWKWAEKINNKRLDSPAPEGVKELKMDPQVFPEARTAETCSVEAT